MKEHASVTAATKSAQAMLRMAETVEEHVADLVLREHELATKVEDLKRALKEMDERARLYEERCNELSEKAGRHDRIDEAAGKLVEALDRLPLKMEDAGIIPGAARPAIELYGTYDWQNVMEAKFGVKQAMK